MKKGIVIALALTTALLMPISALAGSFSGTWEDVFDGYGRITKANRWLYLEPMASTASDETHAALVLAKGYEEATDYTFKTTEYVSKQLRSGSDPNPWEVGWIFFRYTDLENYYYFILKTNGVELGKKQGSDEQIFLVTKDMPQLKIGESAKIKIKVKGDRIRIAVNGKWVIDYTDPDPLLNGTVGLYTEDAAVVFYKPVLKEQ